jgi:hypothetical protein
MPEADETTITDVLFAELRRIEQELGRLDEVRDKLVVEMNVVAGLIRRVRPNMYVPNQRVGASSAARMILADHPGIARTELIDLMVERAHTESADPRKTMSQTILNLVQRGELIEREGHVWIAERKNGHGP